AGDDAAIIPFANSHLILTTDMLHRTSDFPTGASPIAIGWRSVAVSLSDLAAMGATPLGVLLALGDPKLEEGFVTEVLEGAMACCESVETSLIGGDIDRHQELTLVSTGIGEAKQPIRRAGAHTGEFVCVTGELGRTQAALALYAKGETKQADTLFQFSPRVNWGKNLVGIATSMIDISDGLAHSLHLLAKEGSVGFTIDEKRLPFLSEMDQLFRPLERSERIIFGGEDYELLFTVPEASMELLSPTVSFRVIGQVVHEHVQLDDQELPDRGWEHGK
ncbi:thiamine-phosphate kinase, partial [Candidatus Bipolaricaulota bacterium]|nr:thiamine-phosphate kinase [Candidatus Bipolaricaulota bacterium]